MGWAHRLPSGRILTPHRAAGTSVVIVSAFVPIQTISMEEFTPIQWANQCAQSRPDDHHSAANAHQGPNKKTGPEIVDFRPVL
jgi:hypothetical protein